MERTRILHYEMGSRLGRGGMGEVYQATDLRLDRRVALKFVAPELAADPEALERFEREARAAAALHHPHIATLFAFEHDGDRTFIAMELVGGESLRTRILRGPLPVAEALSIARDVAGALALAHRRGIAHRDVKPENLMFDDDGRIKLMDFGLARAVAATRITMTGTTLGTAAYMAPEATRGATGPPADVFALGIVLYEMLTGALPFPAESPLAMMFVIANEEPKPVRVARPEVSEAVAALIGRMLEKDPEARPDAASVARELAALTGAPPPPPANDTVELDVKRVPHTLAPVAPAPPPVRRHARAAIVFGGLAVAIAAALLLLVLRPKGDGHDRAVALDNEGYDLLRADSVAAARSKFEAALAADPRSGEATLNLAYTMLRLGDRSRAAELYGRVIRDHPGDPHRLAQAHAGLGDIAMNDASYPAAIEHYGQANALDSTIVANPNNLAFALIGAGRLDEAEAVLRQAMRRFPGVASLYKNAALIHFQRGEYVLALALVDDGIKLDPTLAAAWALRSRIDLRRGKLADASADRDRFADLHPPAADVQLLDAEIAGVEAVTPSPSHVGRHPATPLVPTPPRVDSLHTHRRGT
jgi:serine/threonine-protein kinase